MDIRDFLFAPLTGRTFMLEITARQRGVLAGTDRLQKIAQELGLKLEDLSPDGTKMAEGSCICRARGDAWQVARAEEQLLGVIGKASGVATAAAEMVYQARSRARVVCGAWKKVPPEVRHDLRQAIATGGAGIRIVDEPFVYLDKNYVRMFGGVGPAVRRARELEGRVVVVQLRGEEASLAEEAVEAAAEGAHILMVDTGRLQDLVLVRDVASKKGFREKIRLAFSGGVVKDELDEIIAAGADIVDVGRAIIDAPLLDFTLDVKKLE
ncbi:nicotinate-nucleotide pyrophosphorylase [Thermosediminibacter oceani]|uniref:Quinolinate phosphoribosyl transferase n=1 Tax=Thermosediminibacter oceani (strain ATCC BAA-1034 / DSM 16646 / JW/IW-1228P) TaxID=555079 RepID=D9S0Z1_THEOJ|nr:nicotinate-nucleotide pyrophosphorylase [Thermosediminibacter oceani]ADL07155.1 Quinolinate phosphoribosyl transferase [Thermosediminibacter oceani DSM 16646]